MHYVIVIIVVAVILAYQFYIFVSTQIGINKLRNLFPYSSTDLLCVENSLITNKAIADEIDAYEKKIGSLRVKKEFIESGQDTGEVYDYKKICDEIKNLELKKEKQIAKKLNDKFFIYNDSFTSIIASINGYLEKNRTGNTDYHLMKDIVERCSDTQEENVSTQVPIPLYAGLMGTMIGAIVGIGYLWISGELATLLEVSNSAIAVAGKEVVSNPAVAGKGIEALLACVAMAMAASFVGILLTTVGSIKLKNAKIEMANSKDTFLSWLQQNLLPAIANDTSSALIRVSQDLAKFGKEFTQNTNKLQQTIGTLNSTTVDQKELIESLQQINITKVAKANVDVYDKLKDCTEEIENLTSFLHNSHSYLQEVKELNSQLDKDDRRSKSFERMADFFEKELNQIEERKAIIAAAVDKVDDKTHQSLDKMASNSKEQFASFNAYLDKQTEDLKKRSTEIGAIVDELKRLAPLEKVVSQLEHNTKEQNAKMGELMKCIENLAKAKADGGSGTIQPWFTMVPLWMKIVISFGGVVFLAMCGLIIFMIVEQRFFI